VILINIYKKKRKEKKKKRKKKRKKIKKIPHDVTLHCIYFTKNRKDNSNIKKEKKYKKY
jgi:hypothetical protein